eukprot:m.1260 g.1260  ORF g.1260 m.1260 type:complete len:326 (+) comp5982_c0_seq1:96-1073(+)
MAALATWTIPTPRDDRKRSVDEVPRSRVRPEAQAIADLHVRGTVHLLFQPEVRPSQPKLAESKKKNHVRENVSRMRQIQAMSRKLQKEAKQPIKATPWRSEKYDHVESKVAQRIRAPSTTGERRPASASGQHPGPNVRPVTANQRPSSAGGRRPENDERPSSQRPGSAGRPISTSLALPKKRDFVSENARRSSRHRIQRSPSADHLIQLEEKRKNDFQGYKRGSVPSYLLSRQRQWAKDEEERQANAPDPMCPPGHVLMPKSDQLKTLNMLDESKTAMLKQLQTLPVGSDSLRVRTRKTELESKLVEIDDAIKVFSRPKVFVRDE